MSKRTQTTAGRAAAPGRHNPRQPCPCGSGKRYKACHGAAAADDVIVVRPFEGLAAECQLVALREFVPSATAPLPLAEPGERDVTLSTVLPTTAAAMVRADGTALVAMQVLTRSGDLSRDLARAARWAQTATPGEVLASVTQTAGDPVRLQDLLVTDATLDITMYPDFTWWIPGEIPSTGPVALALQRANSAIMPTEEITGEGIQAAYWVDAGDKAHLRWVRPEPEERLLAALARLSVRGELDFGDGSRYAGSFRAHGVLVPVWDLDLQRPAQHWAPGAETFARRLLDALASLDDEAPTDAERRALHGLRGRQITLR